MRKALLGVLFLFLPQFAETQETCNILAKLREPDPVFENLELSFGQKTHRYFEIRHGVRREYRKPLQEIGLRVLHLDTCRTEVIKIKQKGNIPDSPPGWHVQVEARPNGVQWNLYNSQYDIEEPADTIVLENKVLKLRESRSYRTIISKSGKKSRKAGPSSWKSDGYYTYSPYTRATHIPEIVSAGHSYQLALIERAFADLRDKKIMSKAVPGKLVTDSLNPHWFYRLRLTEHMDYGEFSVNSDWKRWSAERVLVLIGLNGPRSGTYVCNLKGACGPMQFTDNWRTVRNGKSRRRLPGTYSTVAMAYPAAKLIRNFEEGAKDDLNSMKAAILLHDLNLLSLIGRYGPGVIESQFLEGVLGARYNASPAACQRAADAAFRHSDSNWAGKLKYLETRGYIEKMEYLQDFEPSKGDLPPEITE